MSILADVKDDKYPCLGTKCGIPWMGMMSSKFFRKAVAVMGLLALLSGLFGCQKTPKPAQHIISEISAVSIACAHMDYSYGYYFQIHRIERIQKKPIPPRFLLLGDKRGSFMVDYNVNLEGKTVLVTGAAGFIGSNLVKRLFHDVK